MKQLSLTEVLEIHEETPIDWQHKRNAAIAKELGAHSTTIAKARKLLGFRKPKVPRNTSRIQATYGHLDWSKENIVLSEEIGVSREAIRVARLVIFGKPKSKRSARRPKKDYERIRQMAEDHPTWTKAKLQRKLGVSNSVLDRALPGRTKGFVKYPWQLLNWSLPRRDLARIWGIPAKRIYIRSSLLGKQRAQYEPRARKDYGKLLLEEKQKASGYRKACETSDL